MPSRANAFAIALALLLLPCAHGAVKPIVPPGAKPTGPRSPGILTDEFLYISGQGASDGQFRTVLENVRMVVEAAGLTMEHVVYTQVYLTGGADTGPLDRVFKEFFPNAPPARSAIGVARLAGSPVMMSAVAVRDLSRKNVIPPQGNPTGATFSAAVLAAGKLYLSDCYGINPATGEVPADSAAQVKFALANMEQTLKAAGAGFANMVFVNPYLTGKIPMGVMNEIYAAQFEFGNTPARATIQVSALPGGANIAFTGVAVMDLSQRRAVRPKNMPPSPTASPCVFAGDTFYCSAKSGFIPGPNSGIYAATVETQLRQTMRNLLDGLEEAGLTFAHVVSSNVYLDNLEEGPQLDAVYAEYLKIPPASTTVQQLPPASRTPSAKGTYPTLEQISIVAVR